MRQREGDIDREWCESLETSKPAPNDTLTRPHLVIFPLTGEQVSKYMNL